MNKVQKNQITRQGVLAKHKKLFKTKEALVNYVLEKKFGKNGKLLSKNSCDDGDACGERCFD